MQQLTCEFRRSPGICTFLEKASKSPELSKELKEEASSCLDSEGPVPWRTLHNLCAGLRSSSSNAAENRKDEQEEGVAVSSSSLPEEGGGDCQGGPWLHQVVADSGLMFKPPPQRPKNPAHEARMAALREQEKQRKYEEMTADVEAREIRIKNTTSFSSFKDQIGFGVHVIVVMFTLYLLGAHVGKSISKAPVVELAGGLVGCIAGLFLETTLFIIRSSR